MGGEGGVRRRPARAVAYGVCGAVLLGGCASMPDHGDLRGVESTPRQDTQVRVFAMPPQEGALPMEIVQGFLEALTSDDPTFSTARKYLIGKAAKTWDPDSSTTVLDAGPQPTQERPGGREGGSDVSFTLDGRSVATVDDQQSYTPVVGKYQTTLHLVQDDKDQWRIDELPQGVVMGQSDFARNYMSVNKYYFASHARVGSTPAAVADPVYVRKRVDPTTQMVRSLLAGPTSWLRPVVRSSFPTGTALEDDEGPLTPNDQNKLTVPLNGKAAGVGQDTCDAMAAQLLFTMQSLTPGVDEVELRADGRRLCSLSESRAETIAARGSAEHPAHLYFIDGEHRLQRMDVRGNTSPESAPGAFGDGGKALRSVGVSRDEQEAAGVTLDGKQLYVTSLLSGGPLGNPLLTSAGATEKDRLTTPSWDAQGDLWVADRNPLAPRLHLIAKGDDTPVVVSTPGLSGRINTVRVAADGVRIALVVESEGQQSLYVGRVERDQGDDGRPVVAVQELRSATPELEQVTAVSWASDSRLVVVGKETGGVEQVQYVQCDGSLPETSALPGLTEVQSIAASEDSEAPLFATSKDGLLWLPGGSGWRTLKPTASVAFYPG
ncbi:GerMN domain-containing protein [Streptomyces roseirectus]|uniref:Lipoprotein LpqB n=1 Tax=Streptomyces roseirectus TaxID=2768066 RepID=A0A7H0IHU4_9ACTN|nr:LpqB family beta-propeller domain-containing protein [Streptomyces roseirectus]QNP72360.1 GerMN domain-containing protein [Streptomyces roseirectus]